VKVGLLAPIATGLYSRIVAHRIAHEPGLELAGIVARTPWSAQRIKGELKRDGPRLLRKVYKKLVLGERDNPNPADPSLSKIAAALELRHHNLKDFASHANVPFALVKDHNEPSALELMRHSAPDVIAFCGGGLIRKDMLDMARLGVLNCHMGPLPEYRGMDVVEYPLIECGEGQRPSLGLTLHRMDRGVDTGPILFVKHFDLQPGDTFLSIRQRMSAMMADCMLEALCGLRDGSLDFQSQPAGDWRQFYVMHPRVYELSSELLRRNVTALSRETP